MLGNFLIPNDRQSSALALNSTSAKRTSPRFHKCEDCEDGDDDECDDDDDDDFCWLDKDEEVDDS